MLLQVQARQKRRYDTTVCPQVLQPGQQVFSTEKKLLAHWQGAYEVVQRKGEMDYEV